MEIEYGYDSLKVELLNYNAPAQFIKAVAHSTLTTDFNEAMYKAFYNTEEEVKDFIRKLVVNGHMSPFEFINVVFYVENISRVTAQQLTRHRIASYMQQSFRHVKPTKIRIPIDPSLIRDKDMEAAFEATMKVLFNHYNTLVENGFSFDQARYVLPMGTLTNIVVGMNFRELIHFCSLRLCTQASEEIRLVASKMVDALMETELYPLANFLNPSCFHRGFCPKPCKEYIKYIKKRKEVLFL